MPSFDVVSKTDLAEVDNALNGVEREIKTRFDLANTKCAIVRSDDTLTLTADDSMKMTQVEELLRKYLAMRKVELGALDFQKAQYAAGSSLREIVNIKQGIDSDLESNNLNLACSGLSSWGGGLKSGKRSFTSETTSAMSAAPAPISDLSWSGSRSLT